MDPCSGLQEHLGALVTNLRGHGSAGDTTILKGTYGKLFWLEEPKNFSSRPERE